MQIHHLHDWNLSPAEARKLQTELASRLKTNESLRDWQTLAAADVSYLRGDTHLYASVVIVKRGTFELIERAGIAAPVTFPYVPGLLSFREIPPLLMAFEQISTVPDVVLGDGQGIAHPRRIGFAAHLGLWLDLPTIGCAKSRLFGTFDEPGSKRGQTSPLHDHDEVIGSVVRTRDRTKPLFVSVGHRCNLQAAVDLVLETAPRTRLPEPARMAHAYVNELRRTG
jgi:deoxyribonuclease V